MKPLKQIPFYYNSNLEFVMNVTEITETLVSFDVHEAQYGDRIHVGDLYFSATVKSDGCSHIHFGKLWPENDMSSGYIHLCGKQHWKMHCAVMEWVYKTATSLIKNMDEDELWND